MLLSRRVGIVPFSFSFDRGALLSIMMELEWIVNFAPKGDGHGKLSA
jgi:hypothetical protein